MPFNPPTPPKTIALTDVALNPAAPLSAVQPSANPLVNAAVGMGPVAVANLATNAVTEPLVPLIAFVLNGFLDWLKNRKRFPEEHTFIALLVLAFVIAVVIWLVIFRDDVHKAVTNAFGIVADAHVNYHGLQAAGVGILKPTAEANKFGT